MGDFKQMAVWQKAHEVALSVYRATGSFPRSEAFGLSAQLRRGAVSIAANIAEASGRSGDRDQARFLQISKGSAKEVESHLLLARDLRFLRDDDHSLLSTELVQVQRMLSSLIRRRRPSAFSLPPSASR